MTAICYQCRGTAGELIAVGIIGQDNSGGGTLYACAACRKARRLMPMKDWKHIGDGRPQYYSRTVPERR
ncbi:hypothetical protein [Actinacidiphila oryziradicis]|uniref:Uncharacterized protein n=1 Tax=Actinacidiphila oryziradicis TaxID=2571141 RepID=A0A4U0T986_9ACTN|nr:hypothetical protein [Actinacidiphila oryziradicis]TKA13185.1 hypothetical protein FCI23_00105 [Actinacidiphila oryziradicis]